MVNLPIFSTHNTISTWSQMSICDPSIEAESVKVLACLDWAIMGHLDNAILTMKAQKLFLSHIGSGTCLASTEKVYMSNSINGRFRDPLLLHLSMVLVAISGKHDLTSKSTTTAKCCKYSHAAKPKIQGYLLLFFC